MDNSGNKETQCADAFEITCSKTPLAMQEHCHRIKRNIM